MPIVQPSAATSREFAAVALALRLLPRQIRNDINRETRATLNPVWREIIGQKAATKMDRLVLAKGAKVVPGNPTQLVAASSRKPLSDGLVPDDRNTAAAFEFGSPNRNATETYDRRTRAGTTSVTRHTERQLPWRKDGGRVVFAAFTEIAPRLASLWVQIIVRNIAETYDKK